eukprot:7673161-Alexandrium_andersonii.AAC.1
MAKDCVDCGLEDCALECAISLFCSIGLPRAPLSFADSESARKVARNAPHRELRGPDLRPFLGLHSS